MIFSLSACGAIQEEGDKLIATVRSSGSKQLKLAIKGEFEGCTAEIYIPTDAGGAHFIDGKLDKQTGKRLTYTIKPLEAGSCGCAITITDVNGKEMGSVYLQVLVSSDLKITCEQLIVADSSEYVIETPEFKALNYYGGTNRLILTDNGGTWSLGEFEKDIIDVNGPEFFEEGYSKFNIIPQKVGNAQLQLINRDTLKQCLVDFEVVEQNYKNMDGESMVEKIAKITSYQILDVTRREIDPAAKVQDEYKAGTAVFGNAVVIPDAAFIESIVIYNSKNERETISPSEVASLKDELPEGIDSIDMTLSFEGCDMFYSMSKATTLKAEEKAVKDINAMKIEDLEDIAPEDLVEPSEEVLEIGGRQINYYHTKIGFGRVIWQEGDFVGVITITNEDQTKDGNISMLKKFFQ